MKRIAAVGMMLMVALVGCGDDPTAPQAVTPEGFRAFRNAKAGFAVATPFDWVQIPLNDDLDEFNIDANRIRLANPKLASAIVAARELSQNGTGELVVVRPDGRAKLNVTYDRAPEKTIEEIATASTRGLLGVGATEMKADKLTLDGRPAMRLSFKLQVDTDEGKLLQNEFLYIVQRDRNAFFLTVIGTDEAVAQTIASSLRIR